MYLKLPAKMVDHLVDRLRFAVSRSREHERAILQMAVRQAKMPKMISQSFHENEANTKWIDTDPQGQAEMGSGAERIRKDDILEVQARLARSASRQPHHHCGTEGHQPRHVHR